MDIDDFEEFETRDGGSAAEIGWLYSWSSIVHVSVAVAVGGAMVMRTEGGYIGDI